MAWFSILRSKQWQSKAHEDSRVPIIFRIHPFVFLLLFMALNHIILNLKTVLSSWLLPAMSEQMVGAERVDASTQGRVKLMMCIFCHIHKTNMKTKLIFSKAFCLLLLFEARVSSKFSGAIKISYRLHYVMTLHNSFHLNFLFSVTHKLPECSLGGLKMLPLLTCLGVLFASRNKVWAIF